MSTKYVGSRWQTKRSTALHPSPCTSQRSRTAGMAAQYVPRNGTTPRSAASAKDREGLELEMTIQKHNYVNGNSFKKYCVSSQHTVALTFTGLFRCSVSDQIKSV